MLHASEVVLEARCWCRFRLLFVCFVVALAGKQEVPNLLEEVFSVLSGCFAAFAHSRCRRGARFLSRLSV